MAVVYTKSAGLTAMDTAGGQSPSARLTRGSLKSAIGKIEIANGDSIGSILRAARVPSHARVQQVLLRITGTITTAAGDIGVYRYSTSTTAAGTVVDVDLFASAQALSTALNIWTDVTNESTNYTATLVEQPLWQAAGLSADPQEMLEIAVTLTAAAGAAGQVTLCVIYAD